MQFLEKQLGREYKIEFYESNDANIIKIYKFIEDSTMVDPEMFVELNNAKDNENWELFSVQRDKKFNRGQFNQRCTALFALFILAMERLGSDNADNEVRNKLIELKSENKSRATETISSIIKNKYFSLGKEVKGAINLEHIKNNNYNIYYLTLLGDKVSIVENREAPNAYLVIYNFAVKLVDFDEMFNEWTNAGEINLDIPAIEKIRCIYLNR